MMCICNAIYFFCRICGYILKIFGACWLSLQRSENSSALVWLFFIFLFIRPDMWIYILKIFVTCWSPLQSSENSSALVWLFFIFLFIRPDMWIYILKIFVTCWSPLQSSMRIVVPSF